MASSSEGLRMVEQGGVRIDGAVVSDKGLKVEAGTWSCRWAAQVRTRHAGLSCLALGACADRRRAASAAFLILPGFRQTGAQQPVPTSRCLQSGVLAGGLDDRAPTWRSRPRRTSWCSAARPRPSSTMSAPRPSSWFLMNWASFSAVFSAALGLSSTGFRGVLRRVQAVPDGDVEALQAHFVVEVGRFL